MNTTDTAYIGARIFDGIRFHENSALVVSDGRIHAIVPSSEVARNVHITRLESGIIAPGYVDLQVNGGGGVMFNDNPSVKTLATMSQAHVKLGTTSLLPTCITDTPETTTAAINAVKTALAEKVPGIVGLHLEGPHLAESRMGAHSASLIRTMQATDQEVLIHAAEQLPCLKVTIAPESVSFDQMCVLSQAGILLSLGHSDASYTQAEQASKNGVRCVTHLFNAMSQLGNRNPGLVGAAIDNGALSAGIIADMIHVHPASISIALRAKRAPGKIFLVSDAMATAGSEITSFTLNGRTAQRHNGRLTLADGTIAGADLDLSLAIRNMVNIVGTTLDMALQMATSIPAQLIGRQHEIGTLTKGTQANFIHLSNDIHLQSVWQFGQAVKM